MSPGNCELPFAMIRFNYYIANMFFVLVYGFSTRIMPSAGEVFMHLLQVLTDKKKYMF